MSSSRMDIDGDEERPKQCFSSIQNRKLPSIPSACRLCPSMDLIVVAIGDALWIHRTVSWQRLALQKIDESLEICAVCWSSDGRCLAVALSDGIVVLHNVEALSADDDATAMHTLSLPCAVVSLTWSHVGRPHPTWTLTDGEVLQETTWNYQKRYLDRSSTFLPPSSYHIHDEHGEPTFPTTQMRPSCQTPLSLLCAATSDRTIHLHLHGRYPIATLSCPSLPESIVCTSDLSHVIVQSSKGNSVTVYHIPAFAQEKYSLQIVSALYCSITSHIDAIEQSSKEVAASWKSSLKPLDVKFEVLTKTLSNYGVSSLKLHRVLHDYLLKGSQEGSPETSALDQFFANVQMNDQLMQRLERSLHSAVANVETLARRGLLSPARSLAFETGNLQCDMLHDSTDLQQASHVLVLAVEDVVSRIVEARFRLRDLVSWLRSAGSQNKARGTAPKSAHRENAKKRRVSQAVMERMASYFEEGCHRSNEFSSITECLIGFSITEFFSQGTNNYILSPRPISPDCVHIVERLPLGVKRPTLTFAVKRTRVIMDTLFEQPRSFVSDSITQTDISLSPPRDEATCAIHTRIGRDHVNDADATNTFFSPLLVCGNESLGSCRHWSIIARTANFHGACDSVALFAIPLFQNADDDYGVEDNEQLCRIPFYLAARLVLPSSCQVKEIAFYGDDGNSSLSAGDDSGTGEEGRQSLGLLVSHSIKDQDVDVYSEELWIIRYDDVVFQHVARSPAARNELTAGLEENLIVKESTINVQPLMGVEGKDDGAVIVARTRQVSAQSTASPSKILLCGSRGVGGVLTCTPSHVELDIIDLDEDADDEEE